MPDSDTIKHYLDNSDILSNENLLIQITRNIVFLMSNNKITRQIDERFRKLLAILPGHERIIYNWSFLKRICEFILKIISWFTVP